METRQRHLDDPTTVMPVLSYYDQTSKTPTETEEAPKKDAKKKRVPLFVYPALPWWEVGLYFSVLISLLSYCFYLVYRATQDYDYENRKGWSTRQKSWLPLIGETEKDTSNWEWRMFLPFLKKILPVYCLHSIVFNVSGHFWAERRPRLWEAARLAYTFAATIYVFRVRVVGNALICAVLMYSICWVTNRRISLWLTAAPLLYINLEYTGAISGFKNVFLPLLYTSYKLLSYISFCFEFFPRPPKKEDEEEKKEEEADEKDEKEPSYWAGLWDLLLFANYLPYSLSVICTYKDYKAQIAARPTQTRSWSGIICFAIRLLLWTIAAEVTVHFFHFELLLSDQSYLRSIPLSTFCALGYMVGQYFHLKYVVIFGLPNLFARIDGMQPLPGPICVPRLSLYSHMWRGFDRGLYRFFKAYIFLPIAQPTFSTPRKMIGMLTSFGFVLLWHGFRHHYIVWIILNILELATEQIGKGIYAIPVIRKTREKYVSDAMFRRFIGLCWILPYSFSFYSSYYFLTGSATSGLMVERMFWDNTVPWTRFYQCLWALSYCHAQCCMTCDRIIAEKEKDKKE